MPKLLSIYGVRDHSKTVRALIQAFAAATMLGWCATGYGQAYSIDFNSWPDQKDSSDECWGDGYNRPECAGHMILKAEVAAHPVCRSGKCWKYSYRSNEDAAHLLPCSENAQCKATGYTSTWSIPDRMPSGASGDSLYVSFWMYLGPDFVGCAGTGGCFGSGGQQLKIMRFIGSAPWFTGIRNGQFHDEYSACYASTNLGSLPQQWIRLESLHDRLQGRVKLWVSNASGVLSSATCNFSFGSTSFDRLAWIMGNFSAGGGWPPGGGSTTRTIYIDDICVGTSESDRTGVCGTGGSVPSAPAGLSAQ
jgi:hypothetical protein